MTMELNNLTELLEASTPEASAPCRIDLGGTLDLRTFHYPLTHMKPSTFNIALGLRTRIRLLPYRKGMIRISSKGFERAEFPGGRASFSHPMGLMFAVASYFGVAGVHIEIISSSSYNIPSIFSVLVLYSISFISCLTFESFI